jgi:soluble lytic murein transglycosylase-like protein
VLLPVAVVALAGIVVAAVGLTQVDTQRVAAGLGLPVSYVQSARKWSTWYRVPFEWVLATILVESNGKPHVTGDDGKSVGLMQVNVVANAKDLAAAGVTPSQMFDPDTNIRFGTMYLRQFTDAVKQALGGRTPPVPLSWIVRLYYKGPKYVLDVLHRGGNPATALSWAPEALRRWNAAIERVGALTGKGAAV